MGIYKNTKNEHKNMAAHAPKLLDPRQGIVRSIRDSIIIIDGMCDVKVNELIRIYPRNMKALVLVIEFRLHRTGVILNLESGFVKGLAFCPDYKIRTG